MLKSLVLKGNPLAVRKTADFRKTGRDIRKGKLISHALRASSYPWDPACTGCAQYADVSPDGFPSPISQVSDPEKGIFGTVQHSDLGVLTLLATVRNLKISQAVYWISCSSLLSLRTRYCTHCLMISDALLCIIGFHVVRPMGTVAPKKGGTTSPVTSSKHLMP